MDAIKNFAVGQLATGISSSALSMSLVAGQGARFPAPNTDGEFNVVIWDSYYASASEAYHAGAAEIVRVTARSTDTFTITRAQESTTAKNFNTSGRQYNVELNYTALTIDNIDTEIASATAILPVKAYYARISQSGTNNPTVVRELINTTGVTPTLTRTLAGLYSLAATGLFDANIKVSAIFQAYDSNNDPIPCVAYGVAGPGNDTVVFQTFAQDDWTGTLRIEVYS